MIDYRALQFTEENEGYRQFIYQCTADKNTIGIGFNVDDVGLSLEESRVILRMRMTKIKEQLMDSYDWFYDIGECRQSALCDMAYQMGINGLKGFKKSLAYMTEHDYNAAASEFMNSRWARQTPQRAAKVTAMISTGEWP